MDPKDAKKTVGKSVEGDESQVRDLPGKPLELDEETEVRGGRARAGGDDDDLEELEVQR